MMRVAAKNDHAHVLSVPPFGDFLKDHALRKGSSGGDPADVCLLPTCFAKLWMLPCLGDSSPEEIATMVQGLYGMWLTRNDKKDEKRIDEPHAIANSVAAFLEEWQVVGQTRVKVSI